ncbi:hypothetical protein [Anthocerotibacter panamensis]|uniref:hypothetical protein n=1 Tax=Anthocerotibacter panamensis TaxID=2857077 RepID=UPI001C40617A|nr:hypothetical protein [Anthocerotibacter panamensis]
MAFLSLHGVMVIVSAVASLAGLILLQSATDMEDNKHMLLSMTFGCWLVYCLAWSLLRLTPPELEQVVTSLRATAAFAFIFTFACVLSLPLYAVSVPVD